MVSKIEKRTEECRHQFANVLSAKPDLLAMLPGGTDKAPVTGCYFCSKPYSPKTFDKISVKFQGQSLKVYGCAVCRAELRSKRTIDILYFVHNGKSVHWSDVETYDPKTDFWLLDKKPQPRKKPSLELVSDSKSLDPQSVD